MRRADIAQFVQDVIGFAKIIASSVGASGSVQLQIQATDDDQSADTCEWWAHPAISCKAPAGGEALFIDLGGERIAIGVKERRWQVTVADGECVVRALGAGTPAYIKLMPNGTAEVHATRVDLAGSALTTLLSRADRTDAALTKLQSAFDQHMHPTAGTGAPSPPTPVPGVIPVGALSSTASDKVYGS